ncbi:MAG: helix-hairpin-helix domain-containing protein [Dehalococcoidia bacterium]
MPEPNRDRPPDAAQPPEAAERDSALRRYSAHIALALALAAAVGGGFGWALDRPEPRLVEITIPTPAPLVVHMSGAVNSPGVHVLPPGSRLGDAITAAGGAAATADTESLNLAAHVADGSRINIPLEGDNAAVVAGQAPPPPGAGDTGTNPTTSGLVDLNTASLAELMDLPGIGEVRGQSIIQFRSSNGPINGVADLLAVDGIGVKTVDSIRPLVAQQ